MIEPASLDPGERVTGRLAVRATRGLSPYADGYFLTLELGNAEGSIPAKLWLGPDEDAARELDEAIDVGTVLAVQARATTYKGRTELAMDGPPEIVDPDDVDPAAYLPTAKTHLGCRLREVLDAARSIEEDALRELVLEVWTDETIQARLVHAPATKRHHRAHLGGLLEHVHAMLALAEPLAWTHAGLDRDLLVAAILLHALGKLDEHEATTAIEITDAGRLIGPVVLADAWLRERLAASDLAPERALRLRHAVLAHRGRGEGSPVSPRTPEAVAMREIERLDVRTTRTLEAAERMREEGEQSGWAEETRRYLDVWQPAREDATAAP